MLWPRTGWTRRPVVARHVLYPLVRQDGWSKETEVFEGSAPYTIRLATPGEDGVRDAEPERRLDMKTRSRCKFVVAVLCAAAIGPFAGVLQASALGAGDGPIDPGVPRFGPPLVRLTGSFCTSGQQDKKEGFQFLNVRAGDKELLFRLEKAESLAGDRTGEELLQDLAGHQLILRGADKLLRPLQGPEMVGKRLYIEGNLFVSDRILEVTAAGEDTAKAG